MFNTGGAVEKFEAEKANEGGATIVLKVRGCGRFGAYSSQRPLKCFIGSNEAGFDYDSATGLVTLSIPVPEVEMHRWIVEIQV